MPDESFAGLLHDTEVAVHFDAVLESFIGRVRNEASEAVCDVSVVITLDGLSHVKCEFLGNRSCSTAWPGFRDDFEFPAPDASSAPGRGDGNRHACSARPAPVAGGGEGARGAEGGWEGVANTRLRRRR